MIVISRCNFHHWTEVSSNLTVNKVKSILALKILELLLKLNGKFSLSKVCAKIVLLFLKKLQLIFLPVLLRRVAFINKLGRLDKKLSVSSISYLMYSRYVVLCQRWTKKCGLSNKSESEKDQKKFREEGPDCNQINQKSNTPDNIFTESLNSPDSSAGILFNCLKNLEGKIMEISGSSKETKVTQIKGEILFSYISDKLNDHEGRRRLTMN